MYKVFWTKHLAIAPTLARDDRELAGQQWADSLQEYGLLDQPVGKMVRYPQIRISLRTRNPLVLVAEVRQELRRAGVDRDEIHRFSEEALAGKNLQKAREVCNTWVATGHRGE
jgi:SOS response regulatory protein OraA/RecX